MTEDEIKEKSMELMPAIEQLAKFSAESFNNIEGMDEEMRKFLAASLSTSVFFQAIANKSITGAEIASVVSSLFCSILETLGKKNENLPVLILGAVINFLLGEGRENKSKITDLLMRIHIAADMVDVESVIDIGRKR